MFIFNSLSINRGFEISETEQIYYFFFFCIQFEYKLYKVTQKSTPNRVINET